CRADVVVVEAADRRQDLRLSLLTHHDEAENGEDDDVQNETGGEPGTGLPGFFLDHFGERIARLLLFAGFALLIGAVAVAHLRATGPPLLAGYLGTIAD